MAYYYYYQQQHHVPPDPLSPGTTPSELTPLLLLPQSHQPQLGLPMLTPVMPPVTSVSIKTTDNNQQQLPTPNTFIRLCEDIGLFHDLQNIVVMSSVTGQPTDIATTTVPVSTAPTIVTTSTSTGQPTMSNLCGSSAIVTTMMMANPFDETFKQAVLQQQKTDGSLSENNFNSKNTDGDLNTPFISTTSVVGTSNNNSTLSMTTPADMMTKTVVDAPVSIESMMTNMTTIPQPQQQNMFITTSSSEAATGNVLVMMVEQQQQQQQQHNPIVAIQPHHQHIIEQRRPQQRFIVPATTTTTSAVETTPMTTADGICYNEKDTNGNNNGIANGGLNEITTIKQVLTLSCLPCIPVTTAKTLKQNLLVKQLMQEQQRLPVGSDNSNNPLQTQQRNNDGFINNGNSNCLDDDSSKGQQLKKTQKQELLERNRSAAKRCRMKRKQRWDFLSDENRKLKVENSKLRDAITKLLSHNCADASQ